jgi:hypothetical protein
MADTKETEDIFDDIPDYENFSDIELMRLFREFQLGIEDLKKLDKRLKRKKIAFEPKIINDIIEFLKNREAAYFRLLKILLTDPEDEEAREDLSDMIYNKYGIMNKMLEWELGLLDKNNM